LFEKLLAFYTILERLGKNLGLIKIFSNFPGAAGKSQKIIKKAEEVLGSIENHPLPWHCQHELLKEGRGCKAAKAVEI
jgi:hypothetical protein